MGRRPPPLQRDPAAVLGKGGSRTRCLVDRALVGRCMERNAASRRNKRGAYDGEKGRRMDSTAIRARSWMLQNKKCKNVDNTTKIDGKDDRKGRAQVARVGGGRKKNSIEKQTLFKSVRDMDNMEATADGKMHTEAETPKSTWTTQAQGRKSKHSDSTVIVLYLHLYAKAIARPIGMKTQRLVVHP